MYVWQPMPTVEVEVGSFRGIAQSGSEEFFTEVLSCKSLY